MKKLGTFALLLSLSMITLGCKPADKAADPAPADAAPAAEPVDDTAEPPAE